MNKKESIFAKVNECKCGSYASTSEPHTFMTEQAGGSMIADILKQLGLEGFFQKVESSGKEKNEKLEELSDVITKYASKQSETEKKLNEEIEKLNEEKQKLSDNHSKNMEEKLQSHETEKDELKEKNDQLQKEIEGLSEELQKKTVIMPDEEDNKTKESIKKAIDETLKNMETNKETYERTMDEIMKIFTK